MSSESAVIERPSGVGQETDVQSHALIDRSHLAAYTMEERDLECEVLNLFCTHVQQQLERLADAVGDPRAWHDATHGIKGSARGVGAWPLANAAEAAERDQNADRASHTRHVAELTRYVALTSRVVDDILKDV